MPSVSECIDDALYSVRVLTFSVLSVSSLMSDKAPLNMTSDSMTSFDDVAVEIVVSD